MIDKDFVYITLWYTKTTLHALLCEAPTTLIPCWSHQNRWYINNAIVHNISIQHTNGYGSNLQRDNKSSNHNLIDKNTEIIVFEPLHFILQLSAN